MIKKKYKLEEDEERLQNIIDRDKIKTSEDIEKQSNFIGALLYEHAELIKQINKEATLLNTYNKRNQALQILTPETFFKDYFDKYFSSWEDIEFSQELLNEDIILGYLSKKLGFMSKKYQIIKTVLKED